MEEQNDKQLEAYMNVAANLKEIFMEDIFVSVTDLEKFIFYRPGDQVDAKINIGQMVPKDDLIYKTICDGKPYRAIVPKEIFGVPFMGTTFPIKSEQGQLVGAIGIGRSLEKQYQIQEASESLFAGLEETTASIEEINSNLTELTRKIEIMSEAASNAEKQIEESNKIVNMIQQIAKKSNLLGLNASIEAARLGEQGKGFAVVAEEIRNLAQTSNDSSLNVADTLTAISESMSNIFDMVHETQEIFISQTIATDEISHAIEDITENAQTMVEISRVE